MPSCARMWPCSLRVAGSSATGGVLCVVATQVPNRSKNWLRARRKSPRRIGRLVDSRRVSHGPPHCVFFLSLARSVVPCGISGVTARATHEEAWMLRRSEPRHVSHSTTVCIKGRKTRLPSPKAFFIVDPKPRTTPNTGERLERVVYRPLLKVRSSAARSSEDRGARMASGRGGSSETVNPAS